MSETELQNKTWSPEDAYSHEAYDEVAELALKRELDEEIQNIVLREIETSNIESPVVIELGCGRSPIVRNLTENNSEINGFSYDFSSSMAKDTPYVAEQRENMTFKEGNLSSVRGFTNLHEQAEADFVTIENVLYALTVPENGEIKSMTKDEAMFVQATAIKNAASVMKKDGLLILTDPLAGARSLDSKGVLKFYWDELNAAGKRNKVEKGSPKVLETIASLYERGVSPAGREVLKANRVLMDRSYLHEDLDSLEELIERDGLFEVVKEESRDNAYLGHNAFIVARRTDKPMMNLVQGYNSEILPEYNGTYHISQPIDNILQDMGEYLKIRYGDSGVNRNLEVVDDFDKKSEEFIVSASNSSVPIVSVKLNKVEIGTVQQLEMSSLMTVEDERTSLNFYQYLLEKLPLDSEGNGAEKIGELRRFAYTGPKKIKYIIKSFERIFDKMMPYLQGEDRENQSRADVLLCVADRSRVNFFNKGLKGFNLGFEKLDGFKLDRESIENQTLFLGSERYFLEKAESILDKEEIEILNEIRRCIWKNPEMQNWERIIDKEITETKRNEYRMVAEKVLRDAKDSVGIYCLDLRK